MSIDKNFLNKKLAIWQVFRKISSIIFLAIIYYIVHKVTSWSSDDKI